MTLAVGIDIGGTKISGGVVDPSGRVIDRELARHPGDECAAHRVRDRRGGHRAGD